MKIIQVLSVLILASALNISLGLGQQTDSKSTGSQTPTPATSKARARRATADSPDNNDTTNPTATPAVTQESNPTKVETKPVKSQPSQTEPVAAPGATSKRSAESSGEPASANTDKPTDPIEALREEIAGVDNTQERTPLQLKLVDLLLAKGQRPEAMKELNSIATSDEFNPQGLYNAGNAFARLGDADRAIDCYRKAIEQRKGNYSRAFNNLGVILLRTGRWEEAYEALHTALKLENFRYPEAGYNLGRLYAARGDNDLAVREWHRVLTQDPSHTAAREAIARAGDEGRIVVDAPEKNQPTVAPLKQVSTQQRDTSQKKTPAIHAAEKSVVVKRPSASASKAISVDQATYDFLQRARTDAERGNTLAAIDNFKRVIARKGGYFPPANLELSYLLVSLKRYDEAMPHLQLVANRDGARYPLSYFHLARLYELKGELKMAETLFTQCVTTFGQTNPQFLLDLSRVREKQGDYKSALEAMEEYLNKMKERGFTPAWSDERLTALRQKMTAPK